MASIYTWKYRNIFEEEKVERCGYACEKYRKLFEDEKDKKRQYTLERYRNLTKKL